MNRDLKRWPVIKNDPLQAWDTADELILEEIKGTELADKNVLIINDAFGALALSLIDHRITSYTDSYMSARATEFNTGGRVQCIHELDDLKGFYDVVVIKIPKNMSFFEDILCRLTYHIPPGSRIVCGSMVKHLAKTSFELLEKYIGTTTTSLAKKKARLVFATFEKEKVSSPWPIKVRLDGFEKDFVHHSNLFSREGLDIGTRFFLEHIPKGSFGAILDLGCANGVVGIRAKELNPDAQLLFTDESWMAIKSAKKNFTTQVGHGEVEFFWTNCCEGESENRLDLVLCNPPFHQGHTVGDFIAWQMFTDARRALKKGGLTRVIGNSHLGYQHKLRKIFGNSKVIASNQKFMIIDSVK